MAGPSRRMELSLVLTRGSRAGSLSAPGDPIEGVPPEGWWPARLGSGPPVPRCAFVGQGPVLPIVDGLEGSGTAGYADLPVVHSERKFQSHPAVPPGRLIVILK